MLLDKLIQMLASMPLKSQKLVFSKVNFDKKTPMDVYKDVLAAMQSCAKTTAQRDVLDVYASLPVTDADVIAAFGNSQQVKQPLTFDDEQIEYIRDNIYRNRDGNFRLIPRSKGCDVDTMPVDGLEADTKIIQARLGKSTINEIGGVDKFDGLQLLMEQPYEPPYDAVFKQLAPNLQRINIISSFKKDDPFGFFVRDSKMYRNVCSQMANVDADYVSDINLERAMFLLYLVSGASLENWEQLYRVIHFMVRCPDSANGVILYLNDFDAGGNGKSKLVSILQTMFGGTFTSFAPQQLRFTMSLMGKRLVSISEFEDNSMNVQLQGIMKSMTGRDRFQYEGKGVDPIVADTYQNFVISSNRYIYFEDNGIKRRLQNFHCSNLLHMMLTQHCYNQQYLDKLFGNVFDNSASEIRKGMAHSLLNFILNDDDVKPLNIKPQQVVLGSLKNPVLRQLFSSKFTPDGCVAEDGDGTRFDIYRLAQDAKPEQWSYATTTIQNWFPEISFEIERDCSSMFCDVPEEAFKSKLLKRLKELDETSRKLKARTGIECECCIFKSFNSEMLMYKFLGQAFKDYNICVKKMNNNLIIG